MSNDGINNAAIRSDVAYTVLKHLISLGMSDRAVEDLMIYRNCRYVKDESDVLSKLGLSKEIFNDVMDMPTGRGNEQP